MVKTDDGLQPFVNKFRSFLPGKSVDFRFFHFQFLKNSFEFKMKENNKGRGQSSRLAIRVLVVLGITCLVLLALGFIFRDSAPIKGITRRFMMGR